MCRIIINKLPESNGVVILIWGFRCSLSWFLVQNTTVHKIIFCVSEKFNNSKYFKPADFNFFSQ